MTQLDLIAIGRVSVDLYGQQIGSRLEEVTTFARAVGGCPANVAIGAARLGLRAALLTRVGDEAMGRFVREQLVREGVDTRALRVDPQRLTSLVLLAVRDRESFPLIFYRENCADAALCEDDVEESFIAGARAVLVTGTHFSLAAGARAQRKAVKIARAHGRRVILDIDYRPNLWGLGGHGAGEARYARSERVTEALAAILPDCDLIVGTEEELHVAAGVEYTLQAARALRARSPAVIVCKRGARGCVVFDGEIPGELEAARTFPGMPVEIYNVLGAGDAFLAGFLAGYLRDAPHEVSARQANGCGALAVSRLLCSPEFPTHAELERYLRAGSSYAALREDPELTHLHWVTTRQRRPAALLALGVDDDGTLSALAADLAAPRERLSQLLTLAVQAVARSAAGREDVAVALGAVISPEALRSATHSGLTVLRSVEHPDVTPLQFAGGGSLATTLLEWPAAVTVLCRGRYRTEDGRELRAAEERELVRLAAACRAQRRELVLGMAAGSEGAPAVQGLLGALSRIEALGVRPDWWELELEAAADLRACASLIARHDASCRGIVLRLRAPRDASGALEAAAGCASVRGFLAGGSIFAPAARAWLSGEVTRETDLIAQIAAAFDALLTVWSAAHRSEP